jgi:hypothetical protein
MLADVDGDGARLVGAQEFEVGDRGLEQQIVDRRAHRGVAGGCRPIGDPRLKNRLRRVEVGKQTGHDR